MRWLPAVFLVAGIGCMGHRDIANVDVDHQRPFGIVRIDKYSWYVIDPRTETCFLQLATHGLVSTVPVSCVKLKRSVPEAARLITWNTDETAATRP